MLAKRTEICLDVAMPAHSVAIRLNKLCSAVPAGTPRLEHLMQPRLFAAAAAAPDSPSAVP